MIRHPSNTNLTLHYEYTYKGLPIQTEKGPFIRNYLERLHQTMTYSLNQYPRTFAFRVDLRLPTGILIHDSLMTNMAMERFIESFKAKIRHNRHKARQERPYAHDSKVRYVWAREFSEQGNPHYHIAILLNNDAFCALGSFYSESRNMFNRLEEAWASALCLPVGEMRGLVEIPRNACYRLLHDDRDSLADFFYRTSYLCKADTKIYGDGSHGFGASRA
ncbi:inovirus Gp2 family protein [Rhodobacteraceae bacterium CH30]|nr:inovirus Gp2 family protein [Rhodobacteraceae bacterium CH30]